MQTVFAENVRNYHWEFLREMNDVRNDIATAFSRKNPFAFRNGFGSAAGPLAIGSGTGRRSCSEAARSAARSTGVAGNRRQLVHQQRVRPELRAHRDPVHGAHVDRAAEPEGLHRAAAVRGSGVAV
jgi:hypothetical protein